MAPEESWELEVDGEWMAVRKFRELQYTNAGIDEFVAFRLSMVPDLDWHTVVSAKEKGASDDALVDLFID
jgi:hypothetical protein